MTKKSKTKPKKEVKNPSTSSTSTENKALSTISPSGFAKVRVYNVGFGDCFLLTVPYSEKDGGDKRVLIDFGSRANPIGFKNVKKLVAEDINIQCGGDDKGKSGKLHAVVATHRHADHINGFAGEAGQIIKKLNPDLVLQPWTEDPKASKKWTGGTKLYFEGLKEAQIFAQQLSDNLHLNPEEKNFSIIKSHNETKFIAELNLANNEAIKNLTEMGSDPNKAEYLSYGKKTSLEEILPGVEVTVLGPPTIDDYPDILKKDDDPSEYWIFQNKLISYLTNLKIGSKKPKLFSKSKVVEKTELPPDAQWFTERLNLNRIEQLYKISTMMDASLNNTSLILLFNIKGKKLLFSGDAQLENWNYSLKVKNDLDKLKDVNLYKVGHHGSKNATPKTLWNNFDNKSDQKKPQRLQSVLSTKYGPYVSSDGTVPRADLVTALDQWSELTDTEKIGQQLYVDVEIKA